MEEEIDLFAELESKPLPGTDAVRRVMNLYYIIDTSGSMKGDRIESINQVMPEIVQLVAGISNSNNDTAEIKVTLFQHRYKLDVQRPCSCQRFQMD